MKIAYYTHPFLLDCDLPLIREFQLKGHKVIVFISLAPYCLRGSLLDIKKQIQRNDIIPAIEYSEMLEYSNYLNIKNIYFVNRIIPSVLTLTYGRLIHKMCQMIKRFNPDVVHVTYPLDTWEMMLFQFRKKMLITLHDPFPHSSKKNLRNAIARRISIKVIPKIVLLNKTQKESFESYYGVSKKHIHINRLGFYNCILNFKPNISKDSNINILFFGLISPYKGLEYLCEAMIKVHEVFSNVKLTIAGGGKIYFDFSLYRQLDYIEVRNHYIGMEELASLLNRSSFVVCPYKDATQSGVIMTSFAMQCPVIASDVGALKEQIENGKTGILVPACNVNALSNAIIELIKNPTLLQEMKNNIKEINTSGINSWKIIADNYLSIYRQ